MAEGNGIRDEIKLERQKLLEGKNFWYKLKYYVYYYKLPVIIILVLLMGAFVLTKSILDHKDSALTVALINVNQELDYQQFIEEYMTTTELPPKTEARIDDSYVFLDDNTDYQTEQRLFVMSAAGEIDVVIAPQSYFDKYANIGYMLDLKSISDTGALAEYSDRMHQVTLDEEYGGIVEISGINISDFKRIKDDGWYIQTEEPIYFGITTQSQNVDRALDFLEYLQK